MENSEPAARPDGTSADVAIEVLDARIARIARYPFRAKFHLRGQELDYLARRGREVMPEHARRFVVERLSAAQPIKDGAQTPWGGHPVFRAQHATGTCCRSCLAKNHDIPKGVALSRRQIDYIVAVICRWIDLEYARFRQRDGGRHTSAPSEDLFTQADTEP